MKKFLYAVSVVFALIAIAHLIRIASETEMKVGTWDVHMYVSIVGFIVPSVLSLIGIHYAKRYC